ncbi:protein Njmu-R1-like isoform X1 [Acanthaster planci]|uniref:Protein Njmu-R1-like isoform X1 n=1 Tax=Acanthaster planci TaxID=133434 RepID=A0A8B7Y800_ACAPL|nr:protein Njmu-R1-like isoform X1 [Acanthaster planci]
MAAASDVELAGDSEGKADVCFDDEHNVQPINYFALYTYHANRPSIQDLGPDVDKNDSTVANFLQREATSNRDFSLSVIATDLVAEQETELREFIFKRLSRGTVYGGSGNVNNVDVGNEVLSCYYYLLRQQTIPDTDLDPDEPPSVFYTSIEYVICFLIGTSAALELFRPELDAYSEGLLAVLDSEAKELTQIQSYLARWYHQAAAYACRCTDRFQEDLSLLIHTALLDDKINFIGGDEEVVSDVMKFVQVCSLSDLLQHMSDSDSNSQGTNSSEPTLIDLDSRAGVSYQIEGRSVNNSLRPVQLVFDGETQQFQNAESSPFCEEWSRLLLASSRENPASLRQIIEDFKLRTIQDLNTLKRLVRQAESDHYALYRAFAFLRDCGNGGVLLRHIWKDENTVTSQDTQSVLHVLEEFISSNGTLTRA